MQYNKIGIWMVCFLLVSSLVAALGISPPSATVHFSPEVRRTVPLQIINTEAYPIGMRMVMNGDLGDIISFEPEKFVLSAGEQKEVLVHFDFPKEIEIAGRHRVIVDAVEDTESGGGFSAKAAVSSHIFVEVPYPGKYAEVTMNIGSVKEGEHAVYNVLIANKGKEDLEDTNGNLKIYTSKDELKKVINIEHIEVSVGTSKSISDEIDTALFSPGTYFGKFTYFYGVTSRKAEAEFKIGTLDVDLTDYTNELYPDRINKVVLTLESRWNDGIPEVYAEMDAFDQHVKSQTISMKGFGVTNLPVFIDTTGYELGRYEGLVKIYFVDTLKEIPVWLDIVEEEEVIVEDTPKKNLFNSDFIIALAIVLTVVFLVIIIYELKVPKKHKKMHQYDYRK